ncbi:MCE family protein [Actinomadura luteofluorescens]
MNARGAVGRRLAGVAFLLVPVLLVWLSIAVYGKRFTGVAWVTLRTASAGSEMRPHADVKLRGVVVGEVREISSDGGAATLRLAIQPDKVRLLPRNVSAQLLPTTLFGARFVALVPPARPSPERLTAGSVISQDRSANAIELQQVMDDLYPLLTAVRPAELAATLTAVSQALDGRGADLGRTMAELDAYLKKINPSVPGYTEAAPDILQALHDFAYTSRSLVEQRNDLARLYASVTDASQDLGDFLHENSGNVIRLSAASRPTLELLSRYSPEYPCTLRMLSDFVPVMDKVLGKGTGRPGLHVNVTTLPSKGRYVPGKDRPRYTDRSGPHCYPVGGTAVPRSAPPGAATPVAVAPGALGLPNSPEENRLVNELLAPGLQDVPEALPDWSSVLVGPVYRGAEVRIK